jgi:protein-S-isoprenylcysteine O-methyltransferase Ste14
MTDIEKTIRREDLNQRKPPMLYAWIAAVMTVCLILVTQVLPQGRDSHLRGIGAFVLLLASVFIFGPFYWLTKHGQAEDGVPYMQANIVVDQGLYAITRHPQYLGYICLACGFALLSQHWVTSLLAVVATVCFYVQAVREEVYCLAQFGEPYARYCRRVPRFNIALGILRRLRGGNK